MDNYLFGSFCMSLCYLINIIAKSFWLCLLSWMPHRQTCKYGIKFWYSWTLGKKHSAGLVGSILSTIGHILNWRYEPSSTCVAKVDKKMFVFLRSHSLVLCCLNAYLLNANIDIFLSHIEILWNEHVCHRL